MLLLGQISIRTKNQVLQSCKNLASFTIFFHSFCNHILTTTFRRSFCISIFLFLLTALLDTGLLDIPRTYNQSQPSFYLIDYQSELPKETATPHLYFQIFSQHFYFPLLIVHVLFFNPCSANTDHNNYCFIKQHFCFVQKRQKTFFFNLKMYIFLLV